MTDLFDEESVVDEESCTENDENAELDIQEEAGPLDARRRLENLLEERRLREELDDFTD